MIKQIKVWKVTCEKCGKAYGEDDFENYFLTKKEAIETVEDDCAWSEWHIRNGKVYCESCFVY